MQGRASHMPQRGPSSSPPPLPPSLCCQAVLFVSPALWQSAQPKKAKEGCDRRRESWQCPLMYDPSKPFFGAGLVVARDVQQNDSGNKTK